MLGHGMQVDIAPTVSALLRSIRDTETVAIKLKRKKKYKTAFQLRVFLKLSVCLLQQYYHYYIHDLNCYRIPNLLGITIW